MIIIFIVLTIIFFVIAFNAFENKWIIINTLLALLMLGLILIVPLSSQKNNLEPIKEIEIYSMSGNMGVEGRFVLGTGSVDNDIVYIILLKDDYGYYQKTYSKSDYKNIYIVETDDFQPKIVINKTNYINGYVDFMIGGLSRDTLIIYIPENSVIENYRIK